MKNIHVLPTEKPSRLMIDTIENKLYLQPILHEKTINVLTQNIYITSNEDIKVGDYVINSAASYIFQHYFAEGELYKECKKIILTTDQDLIKDGVQSIDDEFLEWFVKNPSCEMVKIEKIECKMWSLIGCNKDDVGCCGKPFKGYKIIIPKEEAKQEFPRLNIIDDWLEKNGDPEIYKQVELEAAELFANQSTKERIISETSDSTKQKAIDYGNDLVAKQETLKEVSPMNDLLIDLKETKISVKESIDIIEDEFMRTQINIFVQQTLDSVIDRIENELLETESKWQQENTNINALNFEIDALKKEIKVLKHQQDQDNNKFSDEDIIKILIEYDYSSINECKLNSVGTIKKWFEKYKNK